MVALKDRPLVGVGVAIFWKDHVLLHKRKGNHAPDVWAFPGGHLEFGETFQECALRETREECGTDLRVKVPKFWTAVNTVYQDEGRHYVVIFMYTHHTGGVPVNTEPDKGDEWHWFHVDALPSPLMMGIEELRERGLLKVEAIPERMCS
jgi:8-oxo-dGTP diphosphatase